MNFTVKICHKDIVNVLLILLFTSSFLSVKAQVGSISLEVEKNRSFKSISDKETPFRLVLSNNSNVADTYSLSTDLLETSCANIRKRTKGPNSVVDVRIPQKLLNIFLKPGESKTFTVYVKSNGRSIKDRWGCIKVIAKSSKSRKSVNTVLSAYITDIDKQ